MRVATARHIVLTSVIMLLTPLLALIYILRGRKGKTFKRWMLTIFAGIYASTFNIESIGDGTRHWGRVYEYYVGLPFSQWLTDLGDIITFKSNENVNDDVFIHVLSYFSGEILSVPGLFFVFVGLIYGYFFSGAMLKIFDTFPSWRKHTGVFILAVYFIAILNLQSMNTVRTWTGFWILMYGVLQYYDTRRWKYLILVFIPPLIHVGYFAMALPIWAVLFLPIKRYWLVVLFGLSFSTTLINPQAVISNLEQTEVGQEKVQGYFVEEESGIEDVFSLYRTKRWYLAYQKSGLLSWALVGIALVFILNGDYLRRMQGLEATLFGMGLLSKVLSNSTWFLFALSNRSGIIANLFILAAIILYWQRRHLSGKRPAFQFLAALRPLWMACLLLILPVFVYYLSNTLEYLSAFILALPMVTWLDESLRISLRELLGQLLGI
jgi:hypothetical protein